MITKSSYILGSEECLSEIGDAFQTRHFLSDLHKENGSLLTGPR